MQSSSKLQLLSVAKIHDENWIFVIELDNTEKQCSRWGGITESFGLY